jgi:hypothetical protein
MRLRLVAGGGTPLDPTCTEGAPPPPTRLRPMEAVFIALMALVVLLSGWVSIVVLYNLFKADNR